MVVNGKELTRRQIEILIALRLGLPYKQLCIILGVTEGSLKVIMSRLMQRTGKNRTQLALIGHQLAHVE